MDNAKFHFSSYEAGFQDGIARSGRSSYTLGLLAGFLLGLLFSAMVQS